LLEKVLYDETVTPALHSRSSRPNLDDSVILTGVAFGVTERYAI